MTTKKWIAAAIGGTALILVALILLVPQIEFMVGGGMVNLGYRLQDGHVLFDLEHGESISPDDIWKELVLQNDLAANVRDVFPRSTRHPLVAILACMDARIDTSELAGDTRRYYYIVRTAGSVLAPAEQEMLELAVLNGVKVLVLTSHSDCAAEAAASQDKSRENFPALTDLMDHRIDRVHEFLARPMIKEAIAKGELKVKFARINTDSDRLIVGDIPTTFPKSSISKKADDAHKHYSTSQK